LLKELKFSFGCRNYPVEYKKSTPGDQFGVTGDITRIKRDLSWKPKTTLADGLKKMVDFEKRRLKK
jgi:nucleoside-diphosphate-sugar epimerase